jgi:ABC-type lipoprotein release transport system permease subunit
MTASQTKYHARMSKLFYPDCYGLTRFVISNREGADPVAMDTAAYDLAELLGVELTNYRLIKEREASTARNRQLLYLLLGVEMALVLSTLLYSAASMAAEQDRFRYGLLQAIGMSNAQILRGQVLQSFGLAIVGAIGANLLVAAVQVFSALFSSRPYLTLLENLEAYPWKLHILVCIGFVFVYTLLQSIPFRNLGRVNVIENLRS